MLHLQALMTSYYTPESQAALLIRDCIQNPCFEAVVGRVDPDQTPQKHTDLGTTLVITLLGPKIWKWAGLHSPVSLPFLLAFHCLVFSLYFHRTLKKMIENFVLYPFCPIISFSVNYLLQKAVKSRSNIQFEKLFPY